MIFLGKFRTCFITYLEAQMLKININWTQARLWYNLQLHQVVSPDRISNPLKSRSACFKNVRSSNDIALFECGVARVVAVVCNVGFGEVRDPIRRHRLVQL